MRYAQRKVAEISVVSATQINLVLDCGHNYLFNPWLPAGQTITDRSVSMQRYIGTPWRCKTCRPDTNEKGSIS